MVINFLGDSITEGCAASFPYNNYVSVVQRSLGVAVNNYGTGGTRIARQIHPTPNSYADHDFIERVDKMVLADMVVVFGGTNDFGHGDAPFGDVKEKLPGTFCGDCSELFFKLKEKFKNKPIIVVLPIHRIEENDKNICKKIAGETKILKCYHDAINELAVNFGFYVLDLWEEKRLNPNTEEGTCNFWDGLHPNDDGHKILGEIIADYIRNLTKSGKWNH